MHNLVRTTAALKRRVLRLLHLDSEPHNHSEIKNKILPMLLGVGEIALIGGAIRDVARAGRDGFKSDLDFVVHRSSPKYLHDLMQKVGGRPNRFGGFAIDFQHWRVDVWHIEDTWARTAGFRNVEKLADLLDCTFFDWDSIIFDVQSRSLTMKEGYIGKLRSNVMDLCLVENPNPQGSIVRALRRAVQWNVHFGPTLTSYSQERLSREMWNSLVDLDNRAFAYPLLRTIDHEDLMRRLQSPHLIENTMVTTPVVRLGTQLELPFPAEMTDIAELRLPA